VIAVGALITCNRKLIKDRDDRLTRAPYEYSPRYQFALKQYGRGSKEDEDGGVGRGASTTISLIGGILMVCFEAMFGNHVKAVPHAVGGHSILRSWLTSQEHSTSDFSKSKEMASPAESVIEGEPVRAISRLDLQIVSHTVDPRPTKIHKELHAEGAGTLQICPRLSQAWERRRCIWTWFSAVPGTSC